MIIKQIDMDHFGKFHHAHLKLDRGINIIYGPNESGKSTLHAFIQCMLFGAERQRGRAAARDTYSRYQPWDQSGSYAGQMSFEYDGRDYRVLRNFHKEDASFSVIDETTGRTVLDEDQEMSDLIPNMTLVNYRNSVSVSQLQTALDQQFAGNMQSFLANMSMTADESVDVTAALEYLKAERKKVKSKLSEDAYVQTQNRIEALKEDVSLKENIDAEKVELDHERILLGRQLSELEKKTDDLIREDRKDRLKAIQLIEENNLVADLYRQKKEELEDLEAAQEATEQLKNMREVVEECLERQEEIDDLGVRIDELASDGKGTMTRNLISLIPLFFLCGLTWFAGDSLGLNGRLRMMVSGLVLAITLIFAIILFVLSSGKNRRIRKLQNEVADLEQEQEEALAACGLHDLDEMVQRKERSRDSRTNIQLVRKEMDELRERYDALQAPLQPYLEKYGDSLTLESEAGREEKRQIEILRNQINERSRRIEQMEWRSQQLREKQTELTELQAQLEQLADEQSLGREELSAIEIAEKTIQELTMQIHDTFGNQLNNYVSQLLAMMTDQAHQRLMIDEKFNVQVDEARRLVQPGQLSAGTAEQIYLAVRAAVGQMLFEESVPFILDDCFVLYDDQRLERTLSWLMQQDYYEQILIFTCHHREEAILSDLGCPYAFLDLSRI